MAVQETRDTLMQTATPMPMSSMPASSTTTTPMPATSERRQYDRYPCPHGAQAFIEQQWSDCAVQDISVGGALIKAAERPAIGEMVTLFIEDVAEMPGAVIRHHAEGFAVRFELTVLAEY